MPDFLFFVIVDDNENPLRRLNVSTDLKNELSEMLVQQKDIFLSDRDPVEFSGNYNVDREQIHRIENYAAPTYMKSAVDNAIGVPELIITDDTRVKGFMGGYKRESKYYFLAQAIDGSKIVGKKLTIMRSGTTYSKLNEKGLVLKDYLAAYYDGGSLFFQSYHNAKKLFKLTEYYREATEEEVNSFCSHDFFYTEDSVKAMISPTLRKKIFLIQKNNILESTSIDDIRIRANELDVSLNVQNGKIHLPEDRKKLKEVINFLNEDVWVSTFTRKRCETNSKRYVSGSNSTS